ncbi:glutathione S-transferase [Haloferax sp. BAB-2207]|nr:glutathione S-transferase C-terminal domain-containing protein [Haloferax sp. BAB-2207]ELK54333.1 glutathione S-transferase [Haloferax sp. BAB-2207]
MNMLYEGEWRTDKFVANNEDGEFERQTTDFRNWVGEDERFPVEAGRYHLYICRACPWAHRTAMTRALKGLEDAISLSLVEPVRIDDGWEFSEDLPDPLYGEEFLRDIYLRADDEFTGRVTVPVLWDKQRETIVNNESREIMRMLDEAFDPLAERDVDLNPDGYEEEVDRLIDEIYEPVNNGVYRAGFATTQEAYEEAVEELFDALDHWDEVLDDQRFLAGDVLTEADIAMFATLIRFDHVYHTTPITLPKVCDNVTDPLREKWKRIRDYENLYGYMRDVYQIDGIAKTVNMDHIVRHYGNGASPPGFGPYDLEEVDLQLGQPHGRDELSSKIFV